MVWPAGSSPLFFVRKTGVYRPQSVDAWTRETSEGLAAEQLVMLRNGRAGDFGNRCRFGMKKRKEKPRNHPLTPRLKIAVKNSALFNHALFDGEAEEFGVIRQAEVLHDAVLVKGHGAGGHVQDGGGFFHGVPFG